MCDEHDLDYQEIDRTLNYYENRGHLEALAHLAGQDTRGGQYMEEHVLEDYIMAQLTGETESEDTAPIPDETGFSLAQWVEAR